MEIMIIIWEALERCYWPNTGQDDDDTIQWKKTIRALLGHDAM